MKVVYSIVLGVIHSNELRGLGERNLRVLGNNKEVEQGLARETKVFREILEPR